MWTLRAACHAALLAAVCDIGIMKMRLVGSRQQNHSRWHTKIKILEGKDTVFNADDRLFTF